ncbi:hypothetical protein DM02DRAFT_704711 [Periconia macrospinosa]|uniref:Nephrocystin 3-like N-terminal domain-containing protein n=1 Tax=Periconia macrospinosa TaxID=97972 RepID=A0A2V1DU67_9PLEO|nr:hypothetical protein DM02DRAFT_704711 [Periconia macrospinosa]
MALAHYTQSSSSFFILLFKYLGKRMENSRESNGGLREVAVESKAELKANQNKLHDAIKNIAELEHRNAQRFQKDRKASTVTRLLQWIHPPEFALKYEITLIKREEGTADWVFSNSNFVKWYSSNTIYHHEWLQEMVLWLYGNPGSGKTILAASTVQELRDVPDDNVCYFFFQANDPDYEKPEDAYRSILAQTLQFHRNNETVLDNFAFILQEQSSGPSRISTQEALDLIKLFAVEGYLQYIVLDGVDECPEWVRLASTSSGLPATLRGTSTKLLLLGRPHLGGHPLISQCSSVSISDWTSEDIHTLIQRRLKSHLDEGLLPIDVNLGEVTQRLHTGAGGMILWADLMLSHLASSALTVSKRMEIIRNVTLPEGLDKMYDRILEHLLSSLSAESKLSQWILMWLVYSRRPLTAAELRVTTRLMDTKEPVTAADFTSFERTVISTCASLVEKNQTVGFDGTTLVPSFRIIHLSAHEYLRSRLSQQARHFMIGSVDAHLTIARCCLQYFSNLAPKKCLEVENGLSLPAASFDEQYPLCAYAALHWMEHLANADAMNDLASGALDPCNRVRKDTLGSIRNFIGRTESLLAYVQATYTFSNGAEHYTLSKWSRTALRQCQHREYNPEELQLFLDVQEFAIFLHDLYEHWRDKLSSRPSLIWHEVTAFTLSLSWM